MSTTSGPKILVADAFGVLLDVGHIVVYAGHDHQRRLTLNRGKVEEILPDKVLVKREFQSTRNKLDNQPRKVWVEPWKISRVKPQITQEAA